MTDTERKKTPKLMEGRGFSFFLFELQRNLTLAKVPKHKLVYSYILVQKRRKQTQWQLDLLFLLYFISWLAMFSPYIDILAYSIHAAAI